MGNVSAIEWTDATWNPVTGCTKVSAGCKNCYAERDFHRPYPGRDFTDMRCHPERLDWPLRWRGSKQAQAEGRPSRIFVNSMSDLFHENVPEDFIKLVLKACWLSPRHAFQILTKRPERMLSIMRRSQHADFLGDSWHRRVRKGAPWAALRIESVALHLIPANVWLGVSVEDQKTADERIPILLRTPAAVRFVSYEPALGPVDLHTIPDGKGGYFDLAYSQGPGHFNGQGLRTSNAGIDWLIAGGESGPKARPPHPDWFRSVRDQCQAAGVPFFFKQWGEWAFFPERGEGYGFVKVGKKSAGRLLDGREWNEFPKG